MNRAFTKISWVATKLSRPSVGNTAINAILSAFKREVQICASKHIFSLYRQQLKQRCMGDRVLEALCSGGEDGVLIMLCESMKTIAQPHAVRYHYWKNCLPNA